MGVCWWHHQLSGHESEQTLRDSEGQGSLACCSSWGHKESDMTEWLNWTELNRIKIQDDYGEQNSSGLSSLLSSFSSPHLFLSDFLLYTITCLLEASTMHEPELPDVQAGFGKGKGTRDQIANIRLDHRKSKRVPEKHLLLLYWLCQILWQCGSQ